MNNNHNKISVVIPTCNRQESLLKTIDSISKQSMLPHEVIIVDSSENLLQTSRLKHYDNINIEILSSTPSVCIQRNIGILKSKGEYVLLCDDDIVFPENYLEKLSHYILDERCKIVTGLICQLENDGKWHTGYPPVNIWDLLFRFIFGLSIWGNLSDMNIKSYQKLIYNNLKQFYLKKGNTLTNSGWPLITDFKKASIKVKVTGLGGSLIEKKWLQTALFEEVLDPHGIGDNYGVCLQLPVNEFIHVLTNLPVYHYKSTENRLKTAISFYRRTLALHYFLNKIPIFNKKTRIYFYWSSIGIILRHILSFDRLMLRYAIKVLYLMIFNKNPYMIAKNKNQKVITPS